MDPASCPEPDPVLPAALEFLNADTQDPRQREHIAGAVARALNAALPAHLRPSGVAPPALAKLKAAGLVLTAGLSPAQAAETRAWFEALPDTPFAADAVLAAPHLIEIAADPNLLGIVREFLGAPPTLVRAEVRWNGPAPDESFRRDKTGLKSCCLRLALSDLAPDAADEYIRGSVNPDQLAQRVGGDAAALERLLADIVPADAVFPALQDRVTPMACAAGAVFLFNGFGLRRRRPGADHLVVEFTFALLPDPAAAVPCRDLAALTSRLAGRPLAHYAFRLAGKGVNAGAAASAIAAPAIQFAARANPVLTESNRGLTVSVIRDPFISRDSKIFAIGSCFALEIRKALSERGFDVYPKYNTIPFDPATQGLAKLPERDNVNHYNSFSIRQEFELAFGGERYDPANFWEVPHGFTRVKARPLVQAPHRKQIFAASLEAAADLDRKLDACIAEGIHKADVLIVTLGLIETWFNRKDGLAVATPPVDAQAGAGASAYADFRVTTFEENYANIKRIADLVLARYPDKQLVFTVSPVVLGTTFGPNDIIVANCESKSTLRAAVGKLVREYRSSKVRYWPSYEIALAHDILEDGGSHVKPEGVRMIMDAFLRAHLE